MGVVRKHEGGKAEREAGEDERGRPRGQGEENKRTKIN